MFCSECTFRPVADQFLREGRRGAVLDVRISVSDLRCMAHAGLVEMGRALSAVVLSGRFQFRRGRKASVQHDNSRAQTPRTSLARLATLPPQIQAPRNPLSETSGEPLRTPSCCHLQSNELPVGKYGPNRQTIALWAYISFR